MDLSKVSHLRGNVSSASKMKKSTPSSQSLSDQHVGNELSDFDAYKVVLTKTVDNRKRRAIALSKEKESWGFTLQTYGIHHKITNEVEILTYVDYVELDGPAHTAGMRPGDVILSINGESMEHLDHTALVDRIKKCEEKMRMVVFFEDCVRKVEMHQRLIKLQRVLEDKESELRALELEEQRILEGIPIHDPCSADSASSSGLSDDEAVQYRSHAKTEGNDIRIKVSDNDPVTNESPARRASQLGNQFLQMFGTCAETDTGMVSPQLPRYRPASPSFGRKIKRRVPLDRDYKSTPQFLKVSPRLVRKELWKNVSSSEEDSDDDTLSPSSLGETKKACEHDMFYLDKSKNPPSELSTPEAILDLNEGQLFEEEDDENYEDNSHVVNVKAARVLGICDHTPESGRLRSRGSSSSQDSACTDGSSSENSTPRSNLGIPTSNADTRRSNSPCHSTSDASHVFVRKKAAKVLGMPDLGVGASFRVQKSVEKENVRPKSQFYVPSVDQGDEDVTPTQTADVVRPDTARWKRTSKFYVDVKEKDSDRSVVEAQSSQSMAKTSLGGYTEKSSDSPSMTKVIPEKDVSSEKSDSKIKKSPLLIPYKTSPSKENIFCPDISGSTKTKPSVLVFKYSKKPGSHGSITKSASVDDLKPRIDISKSDSRRNDYNYGSLGRKKLPSISFGKGKREMSPGDIQNVPGVPGEKMNSDEKKRHRSADTFKKEAGIVGECDMGTRSFRSLTSSEGCVESTLKSDKASSCGALQRPARHQGYFRVYPRTRASEQKSEMEISVFDRNTSATGQREASSEKSTKKNIKFEGKKQSFDIYNHHIEYASPSYVSEEIPVFDESEVKDVKLMKYTPLLENTAHNRTTSAADWASTPTESKSQALQSKLASAHSSESRTPRKNIPELQRFTDPGLVRTGLVQEKSPTNLSSQLSPGKIVGNKDSRGHTFDKVHIIPGESNQKSEVEISVFDSATSASGQREAGPEKSTTKHTKSEGKTQTFDIYSHHIEYASPSYVSEEIPFFDESEVKDVKLVKYTPLLEGTVHNTTTSAADWANTPTESQSRALQSKLPTSSYAETRTPRKYIPELQRSTDPGLVGTGLVQEKSPTNLSSQPAPEKIVGNKDSKGNTVDKEDSIPDTSGSQFSFDGFKIGNLLSDDDEITWL